MHNRMMLGMAITALIIAGIFLDGMTYAILMWVTAVLVAIQNRPVAHFFSPALILLGIAEITSLHFLKFAGMGLILIAVWITFRGGNDDDKGSPEMTKEAQEKQLAEREPAKLNAPSSGTPY